MFIVTLKTLTETRYLRKTIWTFPDRRERAQEFVTMQDAKDQLAAAKNFMKVAHFKAAKIEEVA